MSNLIENLNEFCIEKDISFKTLAKNAGIAYPLLYKYKSGEKTPTTNNLVKLANYLDCTLNYLVGLDDKPNSYSFKTTYDKKVFYERYTDLLKRENLTNYTFSKKINISDTGYKMWKRGSVPNMETLIKIANYFDTTIDYLIGRRDHE